MSATTTLKYPTVNDLRLKTCYVCREEEKHDEPQNPPKAWVHPCNCTLVAHESCLLRWIQSAQADTARAPNALKCPQCSAQYELESEKSVLLNAFNAANGSMQVMGRLFTIFSLSGVVAVFSTGIYVISTAYGAYALQEFIGKEMFDLLLTDDPSNWPWHAFFNLPLIPVSLILSRTSLPSQLLPVVSILLAWPTSTPVAQRSILDRWATSEASQTIRVAGLPPTPAWPPSPLVFGLFIVPIVKIAYRTYFSRLAHWVLGTKPNAGAQRRRRWVWQINEGGPIAIRIGANIDAAPAAPAADGAANQGQQQQDAPPPDAAEAAEQTVAHSTSSLGRIVGGALMIPAISNLMGSLLYRLSGRSMLLRRFLAVRPPLRGQIPSPPLGPYSYDQNWNGLNRVQQYRLAMKLAFSTLWVGTRTWSECDPVWWRNSIGLGLFVVAKDCAYLFHTWLTKRELTSRHVKDRSFEGIDIKELDLIHPASTYKS
ncbi:hypothetical protein HGRIS_006733 [Hohenbuehelia grisea]|uniref:RING-CH-type domain-containing protein n=1 Tax=Hohenbuehelia grisea TaxID=104357 RepID=A0ABR3JBE5_9AGAR